MKLKLFLVIALLFQSFVLSANFNANPPVVVNGKITDKNTGKPLEVAMSFTDPSGKKINTQSAGSDGSYQVVLPEGMTYTVSFKSDAILATEEEIEIKKEESYKERKIDFQLNELKAGNVIYDFDGFDNGKAEFNENAKKMLKKLQREMQFNRSLYIDIIVNDNEGMVDQRFAIISSEVDTWKRFKRKINVTKDKSLITKPEKYKDSDIIIRVSKIENPFE